jgi:PAS domain S-box-containing protein
MVDLSKLKRLTEDFERDYYELENKYKIIVDNLNEGIWQIDKNNKTIFVNKRMEDILGYTTEEMIGKDIYYFTSDTNKPNVSKYIENRKNGISEVHEFIFNHKDGHHVICLLATSPIFINKDYVGAIAGITDITQRKENEFVCKAMADSSFDPIIVHRDGIIIDVNDSLLRVGGYTRNELIGKNSYDIGFPKESEAIAKEHVKNKSSEPYIMKLKHKDGSLHNYEIHGRTLKFNGYSNLRVVVFREVN